MNKKVVALLGIALTVQSISFAQMRNPFHITTEGYVDFDARYGGFADQFDRIDMSQPYAKALNYYPGKMSFSAANTYGFQGKVGYFLNDKKNWGITVGLMYQHQSGSMVLDSFHVEYNAVDSMKRNFRQLVSAHAIHESINGSNINVPFMLHYQKKTSEVIFYSIDAGLLYNISMSYNYSSNGSLDYEAIYQYNAATKSFVYDNNPTPTGNGVIPITIAQYYATNPKGTDLTGFFNQLAQKWGANVGLNRPIKQTSGVVNYQHGSVGFIAEPCINYQLSDMLFLKFGLYYIYQSFSNNGGGNSQPFTGKVIGDYNGLLNETKSFNNTSYGISIGVKYILKDNIQESINYVSYH